MQIPTPSSHTHHGYVKIQPNPYRKPHHSAPRIADPRLSSNMYSRVERKEKKCKSNGYRVVNRAVCPVEAAGFENGSFN